MKTNERSGIFSVFTTALALGAAFVLFGLLTLPSLLVTPLAFGIYAIPVVVLLRGRKALGELTALATPSTPPPTA